MICLNEDAPYLDIGGGVQRKVLATGGGMMTVQFHFPRGGVGAPHSHLHEQVGYVVSGRFEFTLEGKTTVLGPGDSYYVPSNAVHGALALEDGVLVDVFTPQRQDFLVTKDPATRG
jgi:quercetin dioxygenase-like cupin family protein